VPKGDIQEKVVRYGDDQSPKSARPPGAAAMERVRRQFAEAHMVVAGKSSEVAQANRICDRSDR
jgi:hypothetical protein